MNIKIVRFGNIAHFRQQGNLFKRIASREYPLLSILSLELNGKILCLSYCVIPAGISTAGIENRYTNFQFFELISKRIKIIPFSLEKSAPFL